MPAISPVNIEVYVPSPLSETVAKVPFEVPPDKAKATEVPPVVKLLPKESRALRVTTEVEPATTELGETVTID